MMTVPERFPEPPGSQHPPVAIGDPDALMHLAAGGHATADEGGGAGPGPGAGPGGMEGLGYVTGGNLHLGQHPGEEADGTQAAQPGEEGLLFPQAPPPGEGLAPAQVTDMTMLAMPPHEMQHPVPAGEAHPRAAPTDLLSPHAPPSREDTAAFGVHRRGERQAQQLEGSAPHLMESRFTPAHAAALTEPTPDFITPEPDATAGLDKRRDLTIVSVKFRNLETGEVFFEAPAPTDKSQPESPVAPVTLTGLPRNQLFSYEWGFSFFQMETFGLSLLLQSGPQQLGNVTLVENYYFRGAKIRTFQFTYGHVLADSVLTWDLVYDVPPSLRQLEAIVRENPEERIAADTFLFNDDHLVLHNKVWLTFKA